MGMVGGNEGAEARDAPHSTRDPGSVLNVEGGEPLELERVRLHMFRGLDCRSVLQMDLKQYSPQ